MVSLAIFKTRNGESRNGGNGNGEWERGLGPWNGNGVLEREMGTGVGTEVGTRIAIIKKT